MIVVKLKGGMGNQMFQYALALNIATTLGTDFKLDLSNLLDRSKSDIVPRDYDLDIFQLQAKFVHSPALLKKLSGLKSASITRYFRNKAQSGLKHIKEKGFRYQEELIKNPMDSALYEGWFQSYKYTLGVEMVLKQAFQFKHPIIPQSRELYQRILTTNSVCLNVRRTDFVSNANLNTTNLDYFLRASAEIEARVKEPHFFIFSDDTEWCKENIQLKSPMEIVDHTHKGWKFGNYLQLLSSCKHFIIPNSSFAWWGIWLCDYEDRIVIAPKKWFNDESIITDDLIPDEWIRL